MSLKNLLSLAVEQKASDLHLSAGLPPSVRVDGEIHFLDLPSVSHDHLERLFFEAIPAQHKEQFLQNLEHDFALEMPTVGRFRVNLFKHQRGIAGAFRIIPPKISSLEELALPNVLQEIAALPQGLVLVTGPAGSGKTTTLAALVDYINQHYSKHIVTIEDPIEFLHRNKKSLIHQREVFQHTLSFPNALRSALREDPNVLLIGELRDLETIRLALTAAETGHLVLATLHTNSACKSIHRILDVFPGEEKNLVRSMLADCLQAVVNQRLIKKINGGRTAVSEILLMTAAIRNLIREDKISQIISVLQTNKNSGMQTLDQHLKQLMFNNIVNKESAMQLATEGH